MCKVLLGLWLAWVGTVLFEVLVLLAFGWFGLVFRELVSDLPSKE